MFTHEYHPHLTPTEPNTLLKFDFFFYFLESYWGRYLAHSKDAVKMLASHIGITRPDTQLWLPIAVSC